VTAWREIVDDATGRLGAVSPALVRHLRTELDEVQRRVALLECSAPTDSATDGLHAFVALATARLADTWDPAQLIDVASAVELAHRASRHHRRVVDTAVDSMMRPDGERYPNATVVLDGDWSITQAAVLVADIGPEAYRLLVRGYGATQVGQLFGDAEPLALMRAAVDLGALVASLPDDAAHDLWAAATTAAIAGAPPSPLPVAVVAWAVRSYTSDGAASPSASDGTTNAFSFAPPAPTDVQLPSRSTTTSPAVGRS
jgi:hypothetical protein